MSEEQQHDEDAAAVEAGFNDSATETPPDVKDQPPADVGRQEEQQQPEYVQVTKSDWESLMAKAAKIDEIAADHSRVKDTAFGKIGGLERALNELRSASPGGISDEDLAELQEEYPDLANLKVFQKLRGRQGIADADIDKLLEPRLQKVREDTRAELATEFDRRLEQRLLAREHLDWREVVGFDAQGQPVDSPYRQWLQQQPEDYRTRVAAAQDADTIAESISKFKEARKASEAEKAKAAEIARRAAERKDRLATAVPAKGDAAVSHRSPNDEEAGFEEGFKS